VTARPRVAVLDYGIGNLRSAQKALERVGADAVLTQDATVVSAADAVVLPGVGAFGACMDALRDVQLETVTHDAVASGVPFLGICVGMQMLFDGSEEDPDARGLGIIPGQVKWIPSSVQRPQMQWYFVHSLHGVPTDSDCVTATVQYGDTLNVAFRKGNVFATQFHPEKSATAGLGLLHNFVASVKS